MKCAKCGMPWQRAAMLALIIDLGARSIIDLGARSSSDPNYCHESDDHEHEWQEERKDEDCTVQKP